MGSLSLFKPWKSKSYRFIDKIVSTAFDAGGTIFQIHLYLGPAEQDSTDLTQKVGANATETTIQDILLIENRDRKYEKNIIDIKGTYTLNDLDFVMTQFGIMQSGGTLFINFHINQMIEKLGRKIIAGDVLEIIHRRDEVVLDSKIPYIPAFYVVTDTAKAADGYSATWWPHILRVKIEPLSDSQEFKSILKKNAKKGLSIEDLISTNRKALNINDTIQDAGNAEFDTKNFNSDFLYNDTGNGSGQPINNLIDWQYNNDGTGPNMNELAPSGTRFPDSPVPNDYFLRLDYSPPRLFQRNEGNTKWIAIQNVWKDRAWSPAPRSLEDQMVAYPEITFSENPLIERSPRQDVSNPIPPQQCLPVEPNELTPEERRIQEDNEG